MASTTSTPNNNSSDWTPEQDQHLQKGLSTFPSSMEKNERWSSIANGVAGKSKKECVMRFKEIRNALKAKK
jgi:DnaJ family protein C protein 2